MGTQDHLIILGWIHPSFDDQRPNAVATVTITPCIDCGRFIKKFGFGTIALAQTAVQ
jgi:hypothetical protein